MGYLEEAKSRARLWVFYYVKSGKGEDRNIAKVMEVQFPLERKQTRHWKCDFGLFCTKLISEWEF